MPVLIGGRKPVIAKIRAKKKLGQGFEGTAYEVEATAGKGERKRKISLVEKRFKSSLFRRDLGNLRNPEAQFRIMGEISGLNRQKKLGLHILPTIRLRKRWLRKPALIITNLDGIPYKELEGKQILQFYADFVRQQEILFNEGYYACSDAFMPVLNKKTDKVEAYIFDFGSIVSQ